MTDATAYNSTSFLFEWKNAPDTSSLDEFSFASGPVFWTAFNHARPWPARGVGQPGQATELWSPQSN